MELNVTISKEEYESLLKDSEKLSALEAAGVKVGQTPSETARFMRAILGR